MGKALVSRGNETAFAQSFRLALKRGFVFLLLLAFSVWFQTVNPSRAETAFTNLVGNWTATGRVVAHPNAPLERGRCRVALSAGSNGQELTVQGRCAIAARATDIVMTVSDRADGTVRGTVNLSALEGVVGLTGTRAGDVISLSTQTAMLFEGEQYWSRIEITLSDSTRFTLKEWTAIQSTSDWQLSRDLVFERQAASQ